MIIVAWIAGAFLAGQQSKTSDVHYDPARGISVQRPPKKEEWKFKTAEGKLKSSQVIVHQIVDDVSIEFFMVEPDPKKGSFDPQKELEAVVKELGKGESFTDVSQKKLEQAALPGNGAGGAKGWYLEATMKTKAGALLEWRQYCFVSRENRCLYIATILNGEGAYQKNKKDIDLILSSVRTYKIVKK